MDELYDIDFILNDYEDPTLLPKEKDEESSSEELKVYAGDEELQLTDDDESSSSEEIEKMDVEEDVLYLSDEEVPSPVKRRRIRQANKPLTRQEKMRKRKIERSRKRTKLLKTEPNFDQEYIIRFPEHDPNEMDDFIVWGEELTDEIIKEMGIQNKEVNLYNALIKYIRGDVKGFLKNKTVKKLFKPVKTLIESCGLGGESVLKTKKMWKALWYNQLGVSEDPPLKDEGKCVSCNSKRTFEKDIYIGDERFGGIGPLCFERLTYLHLVHKSIDKAARRLYQYRYTPNTEEFRRNIFYPIRDMIGSLNEIAKRMANAYKKE